MDNSTTSTASGVPVNEVVPAPSSVATPAKPDFEAFDKPHDLLTKNGATPTEPTPTYDPATGEATGTVPLGTKFVAVGKYQTPHGVYFTDGRLSIKTVDLRPDPNPTPAAEADDQEQKVEVRVIPAAPKDWKDTYQAFLGPVKYRAKADVVIHDVAGLLPDVEVEKSREGTVVGKFQDKDGLWYYLSKKSRDAQDDKGNGPWYGYPVALFQRVDDPNDDLLPQDIFDPAEAKASEIAAGYGKQHKIVAAAGTSVGLLNRFRGKK